jgi:hypothetical protein
MSEIKTDPQAQNFPTESNQFDFLTPIMPPSEVGNFVNDKPIEVYYEQVLPNGEIIQKVFEFPHGMNIRGMDSIA